MSPTVMTLQPYQLDDHLRMRGYLPAQHRVGVMVYRTPGGKRAKFELTVSSVGGVQFVNEYALNGHRSRIGTWQLQT